MMSSSSEPHGMRVESVSPREYWDTVTGRWKKKYWARKKNQQINSFLLHLASLLSEFSEKLFSEGCRWKVSWHTLSELGKKRN